MTKMTEAEIAAAVIERIQHDGWEVYQEADLPMCPGRCDIAAVRNGLLWIIETKRGASLSLLDQAYSRLGAGHFVSIAYTASRNVYRARPRVPWIFCRQFGIGMIELNAGEDAWDGKTRIRVDRVVKPRLYQCNGSFWREQIRRNIAALHPNMNNYAAGTSGQFWTPFKETMDNCYNALLRNGPMTVREIVDEIDHHYQSDKGARSTLLSHFWRESRFEVDDSEIPHMVYALNEDGRRAKNNRHRNFQQRIPLFEEE